MAYSTAGLNANVAGAIAAGSFISMHTANPGTTGASEVAGGSYVRKQSTFPAPAAGSSTGSQVAIDIPASTTITHWGLWSAAGGGTFLGSWQLAAPEAFGSAGVMQFTPTLAAN